jgi:uncharacterized membrane protein YhiD involved in acid resistance
MRKANLVVIILLVVAGIFVAALIVSRSNGYSFSSTDGNANVVKRAAENGEASDIPFFSAVLGAEKEAAAETKTWAETTLSIILKLLLAVLLSAVLAFRPRKNFPLFQRNLSVSQTQILLAVVAAALMMIVGDNAARAFAIFAAVSLVRFRTNIRDPKEVTVLLISLALGLAAGVGRWELGIALCFFSLVLLYLLEFNEDEQAVRSMELTIRTRNTDATQELLRRIFKKYKLDAEVREIDPQDEQEPIGQIQYYLNLRLNLSTDYLSDRIMEADPRNIEGIQWTKTKSATDIYQ